MTKEEGDDVQRGLLQFGDEVEGFAVEVESRVVAGVEVGGRVSGGWVLGAVEGVVDAEDVGFGLGVSRGGGGEGGDGGGVQRLLDETALR